MSDIQNVIQNLLTNVTVGNDINIDTINQVAKQIVIQYNNYHSSSQISTLVAAQLLEIFKANSGETKKALLLQLLKACQYSEDLPLELREEAAEIYAELESLSSEEFKTLFTKKGKHSIVGQKVNWFLLGTVVGISSNKLKKSLEDLWCNILETAYTANIENNNEKLVPEEIQNMKIDFDNSLTFSEEELVKNNLEVDNQTGSTEVNASNTESVASTSPTSLRQSLHYPKEDRAALISKMLEEHLTKIGVNQDLPSLDQSFLMQYLSDEAGLESILDADDLKNLLDNYDLASLTNNLLDTDVSNLGIDLSEVDLDLSDVDTNFD